MDSKQPGHKGRPGERHHYAKLTDIIVLEMRLRRAVGERVKDLAKEFGVCEQSAGHAINGRTWKHL